MAAKTFDEWWGKSIEIYNGNRDAAEAGWNAAIESLEGVQTQTTNKQSIKLPKEAIENITECISTQQDIPVEFKAVLVNNFWDLL